MPTVSVKRDALFAALGESYSEEGFDALCFEFGLELDEVVVETDDKGGQEITYKIEVGANRYDLLCLEGLTRALLIFQNKMAVPSYKAVSPKAVQKLIIDKSTSCIRPHCVAAILRDVTFDAINYASFIDLQDKLHHNLARKRTLVAIGTHDLDTIKGPFRYVAEKPKDIRFKPLNQTKEFSAVEMMELFSTDSHLKPYLPIIRDSPVYPVIYDSNNVVLSMPPIINGDHSKITLKTRNVLIECTGTDLAKTHVVLDTMVTMFGQYCKSSPYVVESVEVVDADGKSELCPRLGYRKEVVDAAKINNDIGINVSAEKIADLLSRMALPSKAINGKQVEVTIPPTRHDVLHACDIMEDVAIAYGYNNIVKTIPPMTACSQTGINKLSDQLRQHVAQAGFTEALTFILCSRDDVGAKMGKNIDDIPAVHVSNPKTLDFQIARTSLVPGLLKTVQSNKQLPVPLKLFEVSDVVLQETTSDVGARNERRLAAIHYNRTAGFEVIHGLLDRVMQLLEIQPVESNNSSAGYFLRACRDESFLSGRCAEVVAMGIVIGKLGVLHPHVLTKFDLPMPCSVVEINVEPFL